MTQPIKVDIPEDYDPWDEMDEQVQPKVQALSYKDKVFIAIIFIPVIIFAIVAIIIAAPIALVLTLFNKLRSCLKSSHQ